MDRTNFGLTDGPSKTKEIWLEDHPPNDIMDILSILIKSSLNG